LPAERSGVALDAAAVIPQAGAPRPLDARACRKRPTVERMFSCQWVHAGPHLLRPARPQLAPRRLLPRRPGGST